MFIKKTVPRSKPGQYSLTCKHTLTHTAVCIVQASASVFATLSMSKITCETVNTFFRASARSSSERVKVSVYLPCDVTSAGEQFGRANTESQPAFPSTVCLCVCECVCVHVWAY